MKIITHFEREIAAVSLRSACDIRRAWRPTCVSPMSPSSSALVTRAATESTTITSTALLRTSISAISRACSPVSGCETSRLSKSIPSACAYVGSRACSTSMKTADAECEIEGDRAGRDDFERHPLLYLAHLHDRALTELALDLGERIAEGYLTFVLRHCWVLLQRFA